MNNNGTYNKNKKGGFAPKNGGFRGGKTKEEYEAEKAAQIAKQSKSLDIIESVAQYLDNFLAKGEGYKVSMKEVLTYLNTDCGYSVEDTKVISQFNYILMDLANARKNPKISGDRLNIRVLYIEERFKTSFKSELHKKAENIIDTYTNLFYWDAKADGENYNTLEKE